MPVSHQIAQWTKATKGLSKCLNKLNTSTLLMARRFIYVGPNKGKRAKLGRELKYAIVGGTLLISYSYMPGHLSADTVKGISQFSTSHVLANAKAKKASESQSNVISLLTEAEVNRRLHSMEQSYLVNRGSGIVRYDVSQLPSNVPIEDTHVEQIITVPSEDAQSTDDLYFFGIFDGHAGPYTSAKLETDLVPYVARQLGLVYSKQTELLTSDAIDNAIVEGFVQLDNELVYNALGTFLSAPSRETLLEALPAASGSCALLALYDSKNSALKIALAGDSRALVGRLEDGNKWTVESLSLDQTGERDSEVERIKAEHPNEPDCIRNGRLLGSLQPSRAFGDCRFKVASINGNKIADLPEHLQLHFRKEPKNLLTPPYLTARPEITTAHVGPTTKFMVMASDGLFELLSNEEIAGLVVKWMEAYPVKDGRSTLKPSTKGKLPPVTDISPDKESLRPQYKYESPDKTESEYLLEDANVSTHLIRNALSAGGDKRYVSSLISIPSPKSRNYRDDLTVTVVFFGDEKETASDQIILNHAATTPAKPRL
ncbi:HFL304Wp [Eremothecium sinecaudum]|uniref:HFL304Wp n=1 Tax=Eremothecium sinecaudum TaxID=45286 RepID=A0A0X8HU79_9SACH|nr:HFL304Wp [Eremothecium sinecaudum]AMD21552.1 HFL304Wp [Eremothecium sinecaudum]